MKGAEIRSSFLEFFRGHDHRIVRSASLVPENDPTLLFTNAGMVPFKNVFLGIEEAPAPRVADSQKCLRLSGKHNDLEEVGRDTYHHTFFEMLGNWSFGDYGKAEAIRWAWELLTEVWKLPKDLLYATVFRTDDEAAQCWRAETDIDPARVLRFDEKDNFWEMGETGPCGPCSEIHIDRGPDACDRRGEPGHVCAVNGDCARFIELWNLVFIQYDRRPDGSLADLPCLHVDTGMGLERMAAVLQGVYSNYDTDLLRDLIRFVEKESGRRYGAAPEDDLAFRVLADHARALTFMIADGVMPANEGRGYVLRRLLRRAARHARGLGFTRPFLWRMAAPVAEIMGDAYPEVVEHQDRIQEVIRGEEERFAETLDKGLALLEQERGRLRRAGERVLPGEVAFRLYDTYGFPLDMTQDILRADGIEVDQEGFERCMAEQRRRAREARRGATASAPEVLVAPPEVASRFVGDRIEEWESTVTAIAADGDLVGEAREGSTVQIITPETPFYGESGGQVGDRGVIETRDGSLVEVVDAQKPRPDLTVHIGRVVRGAIRVGDPVRLCIDRGRREGARLHHSATHILHSVLRERLGEQVRQAGSLVAPDRLRFDFTFTGPVGRDELQRIEDEINLHVRENAEVRTEEMAYDDAIRAGALAFFGEKYGDRVRVVRMGEFSVELCGGTHVSRTGDIGLVKLRGESGVAAGVRRVEAVSGPAALGLVRDQERRLQEIAELLRGSSEDVAERVARLLEQQRELERRLREIQSRAAGEQSAALLQQVREVRGKKVLAAEVGDAEPKRLLEMADRLRERLGSGIVVLASRHDGRVHLLAAVTPDLASSVHAGNLIRQIAPLVGGRGGGRPELAQAGGRDPEGIGKALARALELIP